MAQAQTQTNSKMKATAQKPTPFHPSSHWSEGSSQNMECMPMTTNMEVKSQSTFFMAPQKAMLTLFRRICSWPVLLMEKLVPWKWCISWRKIVLFVLPSAYVGDGIDHRNNVGDGCASLSQDSWYLMDCWKGRNAWKRKWVINSTKSSNCNIHQWSDLQTFTPPIAFSLYPALPLLLQIIGWYYSMLMRD